ncbi:hypothetical protein OIV83_004164 [Microbotryomycetes sp. JL201]|nr:hypothetical protein OIV83_004164 [Microbotryomycetes sp. JL201]
MPPPHKPIHRPSPRIDERDFLSDSDSDTDDGHHVRPRSYSSNRSPAAVPLPPSRQSSYHDDESFSDSHTDTSEDERRGRSIIRPNHKLRGDDFSSDTDVTSDEEKPSGSNTGVIVIIIVLMIFLIMGGLGFLAYSQGWPPFEDKSLAHANNGSAFDSMSSMSTIADATEKSEAAATATTSSPSKTESLITSASNSQASTLIRNATAITVDKATTDSESATGKTTDLPVTTVTTTDDKGKTTTLIMTPKDKNAKPTNLNGMRTDEGATLTLAVEDPHKCKEGEQGCTKEKMRRYFAAPTLTAVPNLH